MNEFLIMIDNFLDLDFLISVLSTILIIIALVEIKSYIKSKNKYGDKISFKDKK